MGESTGTGVAGSTARLPVTGENRIREVREKYRDLTTPRGMTDLYECT
ncbi:MAG: hypothetical protein WCX22_00500 [Methanoregula sp.]